MGEDILSYTIGFLFITMVVIGYRSQPFGLSLQILTNNKFISNKTFEMLVHWILKRYCKYFFSFSTGCNTFYFWSFYFLLRFYLLIYAFVLFDLDLIKITGDNRYKRKENNFLSAVDRYIKLLMVAKLSQSVF